MSKLKRFNWVLWGCGSIAQEMAQSMNASGRQIYGVLGRNTQKVSDFAEKYGVQNTFVDSGEMLADKNVQVVYIATPHNTHYGYIKEVILAGKHVFCEKAITVNARQLSELCALAREKGVVLAEAMTILYMPLYQKLTELVNAGVIGKVKMIQVNFGSCKEYDVNNRFFSKELAGGALLDIGGYAMTFARCFLDEQPDVVLTTVEYFETGVDEQSGIIMKNSNGQIAVLSLSMRAKQPKRGLIAGEKGFIEVYNYPRADQAVITFTNDGHTQEITVGASQDALRYEAETMENYICQGNLHQLNMSLQVMELLDRVRNSWGMKYPFE